MSEGKDDVPSFWVSNKPGDEQMKLFVEGLARDLANRYNPRPDIVFIRGPPHTGTTTSTIANEPMHVTLSAVWIAWENYITSREQTAHYYTTDSGLGWRPVADCPNHVNPFLWPKPSPKTANRLPGWIAKAIAAGILKRR